MKTSPVTILIPILLVAFFGCKKSEPVATVRPVRTAVIAEQPHDDQVAMTGLIGAHQYVSASFRIAGKMVERLVTVGNVVKAGQPIARLDPTIEKDALTAATADLASARALLEQTQLTEQRYGALLKTAAVSQSNYDDALRQLRAARAQVLAAEARLHSAQEQLDFTTLKAETGGIVTEKCAEHGEVLNAGQPVVKIAENQPMDALFDAPEALVRNGIAPGQKIEVRLNSDSSIRTEGVIYEIAPQSDSATRTYLVKAAMTNTPAQMLLGATVLGYLTRSNHPSIRVHSSALTAADGRPAVWRVEPKSQTVQLTPVEVVAYTTDAAVIGSGLRPGDIVVTAGAQALHQNQKVKLQ